MLRIILCAFAVVTVFSAAPARAADLIRACKAEVARFRATEPPELIGAPYEDADAVERYCAKVAAFPKMKARDMPYQVQEDLKETRDRALAKATERVIAEMTPSVPGFANLVVGCIVDVSRTIRSSNRFYGAIAPLTYNDLTARLACANMLRDAAYRDDDTRRARVRSTIVAAREQELAKLPVDQRAQYQAAAVREAAWIAGPHNVSCYDSSTVDSVLVSYRSRYSIAGQSGILVKPAQRFLTWSARILNDRIPVAENVVRSGGGAASITARFTETGAVDHFQFMGDLLFLQHYGPQRFTMYDVSLLRGEQKVASVRVRSGEYVVQTDLPVAADADGKFRIEMRLPGLEAEPFVYRLPVTPKQLSIRGAALIAQLDRKVMGTRFDIMRPTRQCTVEE